jgi:DNA-binding LytR/AlgR family response regulator
MGKPYIICVDDERFVLDILKKELQLKFGTDYWIEAAESSRDALQLFEELLSEKVEIPLVISDYIMPEIKGDMLLKQICDISPETVAIFLTGQATLQGVTNAVNHAGVYRFIEKPWDKENLYSIVSDALNYYYNTRLNGIQNRHLQENNQKLKQTIDQKSEELFLNRKLLASTDRITDIQQMFDEISGTLYHSLQSIQSGIGLIHEQQKRICETAPENIPAYMRNMINIYHNIIEVFDQMAAAFDYNTIQNMLHTPENGRIEASQVQTPFDRQQFLDNVAELAARTKVIEKQSSIKPPEKLVAWDDQEMLLFNLDDVLFFTAEEGDTFIVTKNGKYKTRDALNTLEDRLSVQGFFRCHRGFLINLKYICKISPWFGSNYVSKLEGSPYEIPISRSRLREIKEMLGI